MATVTNVLTAARAELGYREGAGNKTKYGQAYGMDGVPWCMIFVWYIFRAANAEALITKTASCTALREWGKGVGVWHSGTSGIAAGDIALYNFDSDSLCDHVGIVESVDSTTITAIEGNTSSGASGSQSNGDGVYRKTRKRGLVQGYIRPKYEAVVAENATTSKTETVGGRSTVVMSLQDALNRQFDAELEVDGIIGRHTKDSMRRYLTSRGLRGAAVRWVQARLVAHGYSVGMYGVDGVFGTNTKDAVMKFQRDHGLKVDGIVGINTYTALL